MYKFIRMWAAAEAGLMGITLLVTTPFLSDAKLLAIFLLGGSGLVLLASFLYIRQRRALDQGEK